MQRRFNEIIAIVPAKQIAILETSDEKTLCLNLICAYRIQFLILKAILFYHS